VALGGAPGQLLVTRRDRVDQLLVEPEQLVDLKREVLVRDHRGQLAGDRVQHARVQVAQDRVGGDLGDAPVQVPVGALEGGRVVPGRAHPPQPLPQLRGVRRGAVPHGVGDHRRVERVAHLQAVGRRHGPVLEGEDLVAEAHERGRLPGEHASARPGPRVDQAASLQQADRLVDGGDRHAEALLQLVLGAEAVAGAHRRAEDLGLQPPCQGLGS